MSVKVINEKTKTRKLCLEEYHEVQWVEIDDKLFVICDEQRERDVIEVWDPELGGYCTFSPETTIYFVDVVISYTRRK